MDDLTKIDVIVIPKSSRRKIAVAQDGSIRAYLHSPPIEGKANKECIELFSSCLGLPKSSITIDKGLHGRKKRLLISGMNMKTILDRLANN